LREGARATNHCSQMARVNLRGVLGQAHVQQHFHRQRLKQIDRVSGACCGALGEGSANCSCDSTASASVPSPSTRSSCPTCSDDAHLAPLDYAVEGRVALPGLAMGVGLNALEAES
jgi:hypothetical protein